MRLPHLLFSGIALATALHGQDWNALGLAKGWARQDVAGALTFFDPGDRTLHTWSKDGSASGALSLAQMGSAPIAWYLDVRDQAWAASGAQLFYIDKAGKVQRKESLPAEVADLAWDRTGFYLVYRSETPYIEKREEKRGDLLWSYGTKPKKGAAPSAAYFRIAITETGQLLCTLGADLNLLLLDAGNGKELGKTAFTYNGAPAPALQAFGADRQGVRWWAQKKVLLANVPGSQLPQKAPGQFLAKLDLTKGTMDFLATGLDEGAQLVGMQEAEGTFVKAEGGLVFLTLQ